MKYIALLALMCVLVQAGHAAPSDKVDCSKAEEISDDLGGAQGMTANNDKYKIHTTAEEQKKRCTEMFDAIKTLRKYNKECNSALTQQVFSAVLRTRYQFNEPRCKDPESADFKDSLEASKCAAENAIDAIRATEKKAVLQFQALYDSNIPDEKLRVRRTCCAVMEAKKGFVDSTIEKCPKHTKVYSDYVNSYTDEAMGLICPEESKLDCTGLEPIKTDGVVAKSQFFWTPLIKLVKTLDH